MAKVAQRYAKAIYNANSSVMNNVNQDMQLIAKTVSKNHELQAFLKSPIIRSEVKVTALQQIFKDVQNETKELFELLKINKRFDILADIANQFTSIYNDHNHIENVMVTTATPITKEIEDKVINKVKNVTDKKLVLNNVIDPSIIGGFIIRVGDIQFNESVKHKLQTIKKELVVK